MNARDIGLLIVGTGLLLVVVGLAVASGALGWFGRLPGDIRAGSDRFRVYIPITSMLLLSLALSALLYIGRRIFGP